MESGYVTNDVCDIYFESHGIGASILFLHAGVADSRMWRDQLHLEDHRRVVFDQRGFGKSKWVPGPYSNRHDAIAVLDDLGIDSAVVVGCSNDGEAAMQLALTAPDRVSGLVLIGAAPRGWAPAGGWTSNPLWDKAVAAFEAGDIETVINLDAQLWLAGAGRSLDDMDDEIVELFRDMDRPPATTETERNRHIQTLEPPTNEQLDLIDRPTLVVVGDRDEPELIVAAHYLADKLSDREAVLIEDAAHLPSLEQPEAFNTALGGFSATI